MKTLTRKLAAAALVVAPALGSVAIADGATAKGREVIRTGQCSARATWKLKVKEEDGNRLEVEWEVDSNVTGQTWGAVIAHNGAVRFTGYRKTTAPSGSFTVRIVVPNRAGTDTIRAFATNLRSPNVCRGVVLF